MRGGTSHQAVTPNTKTPEILICGAGIVGLTTALALARQHQSVALLAPRLPPLAPAALHTYHSRVYALSSASQQFLAELGIWENLPPSRMATIDTMEIYGDRGGHTTLQAWQATQPHLAWIVEARELERVLLQAVRFLGITWIDDKCVGYQQGTVLTAAGAAWQASLVVGADGAASSLRAAAGCAQQATLYDAIGLVTHFDTGLPHRGTAWQWFCPEGVFALLPLPATQRGPQVSMVWSAPTLLAETLLALPHAEQVQRLQYYVSLITREACLGDLRMNIDLHGFPLALESAQMVAPGMALVGDAAHRVHPLAGQGLNLGLGDAQALAHCVAQRESFRGAGDFRVLRRYQRARAEPLWRMRVATDGLYRLFEHRGGAVTWLRNKGLNGVDAISAIKRLFIGHASG